MYRWALIVLLSIANAAIDVQELKCLVCHSVIDEFDGAVRKLDPTLTTDIGGFRLDSDGNLKHKTISQAKSELVLSDLMDSLCEKMDDYVRVTWKSNGTLAIMKLFTADGAMNVNFSDVDFVQDDDLNKSLKYYCEGLLEEFEDNIVRYYVDNANDIKMKVCADDTKYCHVKPKQSKEDINEEL